ncbi:hypothetical protein F5B17DRAFT_271969 [Nemania serpens]|nr:hypothetical protein F5B17DRAFT_271969 [Nemania serpens]
MTDVSTPLLVEFNLKSEAIYHNDRVTKSRAYLVSQQAPDTYSVWSAIDQSPHRSKRKMIGQVVSERSIKAFELTMMEEIDTLIRQIVPVSPGPYTYPCRHG